MTARLIVLNGPPASGKSTIAQRCLAEHPMALNLDVDRFRRFLGDWRSDPVHAHHLARDLAMSAAATHLRAGHDVIVPQYFGRVDQLVRFAELADETDAELHEFVLFGTRDEMVARFAARTRVAADPTHLGRPTATCWPDLR